MKPNSYQVGIREGDSRGNCESELKIVEAYSAADAIAQVELELLQRVDGKGIPFGRVSSIAPLREDLDQDAERDWAEFASRYTVGSCGGSLTSRPMSDLYRRVARDAFVNGYMRGQKF